MPDAEQVSKRARQKERRRLRLEAQRHADARARRRRLAAFVAAGLLVSSLVGAAVMNVVQNRAEVAARQRAVTTRLDDLGCTKIETLPIGNTQHFSGQELAANPPEVVYPDRPAAGGRMLPGTAEAGVYDEQVDERLLVHNLEHGYVNVYHGPDASDADVERLRRLVRDELDGFPRVIVAPWAEPLPKGANFTVLSWGKRQLCRDFDADLVRSFIENNHGSKSGAPEAAMAGGANPENPVRPGGKGPFLFPPLTGGGRGQGGQTEEAGS